MTGFANKNSTTPETQSFKPPLNFGDDCSSPAHTPIAQINRPIIKIVMKVVCISVNNVFKNVLIRSNIVATTFLLCLNGNKLPVIRQ